MLSADHPLSFIIYDSETPGGAARAYFNPEPPVPAGQLSSDFLKANLSDFWLREPSLPGAFSEFEVAPLLGALPASSYMRRWPTSGNGLAAEPGFERFQQMGQFAGREISILGAGISLIYGPDSRIIAALNSINYDFAPNLLVGEAIGLSDLELKEAVRAQLESIEISWEGHADQYRFGESSLLSLFTQQSLDLIPGIALEESAVAVKLLDRFRRSGLASHSPRFALVREMIISLRLPGPMTVELQLAAFHGQIFIVSAVELSMNSGPKALLYIPEPATVAASRNPPLRLVLWGDSTNELFYEDLRREIDIPNLTSPPVLDGKYCTIRRLSPTASSVPVHTLVNGKFTAPPFSTQAMELTVYFWVDRFLEFLASEPKTPTLGYAIEADPCFYENVNSSAFDPFVSQTQRGRLLYSCLPLRPDCIDSAVILHELVHAIQATHGGRIPADMSEGQADLISRLFLDDFDPSDRIRTLLHDVFRYDDSGHIRKLNSTLSFAAYDNPFFGKYHRGTIFMVLYWKAFQDAVGAASLGASPSAILAIRKELAQLLIRTILQANRAFESPPLIPVPAQFNTPYAGGTVQGLQFMVVAIQASLSRSNHPRAATLLTAIDGRLRGAGVI